MFNWAKKIIFVLTLIFKLSCFASNSTSTDVWPFGKELDFPWTTISGIWYGENDDNSVMFSFEALSSDGIYMDEVSVSQISSRTKQPVATGTIFVDNNIGSGMMQTVSGKNNYFITIRLVQKKKASKPSDKKYTIVTVESLPGEDKNWVYHFEMVKTSSEPLKKECGSFPRYR